MKQQVTNSSRRTKEKLKEGLVIALAWAIALSLVYIVYVKVRMLIH